MASTPTLIVFDCDGTLADSQHIIVESMRFSFQHLGLALPPRHSILRTVGLSMAEAIASLAPDLCEATRDDIIATYRNKCMQLRNARQSEPMFLGAAQLLSSLAARDDVLLGMATGKSRRGALRFIEENGFSAMFSTVQTADDAPSKPHPTMLFQAMRETGIPPQSTIMIGDTSYDMLMAASAASAGVGVTWGYHSVAELTRAGAHLLVHSFASLEKALCHALEGGRLRPFCREVAA
ncbi:HAD-superfamily hydrolase, subfamily IA, variant 1 [Rhodomicrobium vannielii ATCC 17100]|jgi:phosphoglycolate phosphatase|uniref:HAD-superfamily hydrolase, subfamily IA, variant 1 n=1 Tax=Rhodomicrobium vannielii (strain ATCC 17100 / DSM 162 / LMG 4299 / NCIMB 10020 / ATH 3.1.1) TaxID=648757 RepID=E3I8F9_RHOVT|nr:HAD-IA family hydrolase [Rhodomicrobium vannielii]ADP70868.1 HAD-superfamily hydrolase, subfamily IA, variant 1 [Rhodomicrobium vannielii ATCC 17100]